MLKHLVVLPRGGLSNRLRAIASAKRLCARTGARCTIVWNWGDYRALFDDDTEWIPYTPPMDWEANAVLPGYHHVRHLLIPEGGSMRKRRVPVTTHPNVVVISWHLFSAAEEPPMRNLDREILKWYPNPHPDILERAEAFRQAHFTTPVAGMHIRRTDNRQAARRSPDRAFWKEGDRLVGQGYRLFVATDNEESLQGMRGRYGGAFLHFPKSNPVPQRWPRPEVRCQDVAEDLIDLRLLAACDFVLGSAGSTFTRTAQLLNGSPRNRILDRPHWKFGYWLLALAYSYFPQRVRLSADGSYRV